MTWEVSGHTDGVLWSFASAICSKQHTAILWSSNLAFRSAVSAKSKWCNYTLVLTWLKLGRIPILSDRSDFHRFLNVLIAVHGLLMYVLTSFSVDEILLPKYMYWSINFRGLPFNEIIAPSLLKCINSVLSEFI